MKVLHIPAERQMIVADEPKPAAAAGEVLSRGFSYDILVFERHLENAVKFVDMHRADARFVLDHLGKPHSMEPWRSNLRELAKRENVMCKLSGLVTEVGDRSDAALFPYLEAALEAFGPGRVMFGTDYPLWPQQPELDMLAKLNLTDDERESIYHRTCEKLFEIPLT